MPTACPGCPPPTMPVEDMRSLRKLRADSSGQDLAEYGIALAIIAIFTAVIAIAVGGNVNTLWSNGQSSINSVVTAESS